MAVDKFIPTIWEARLLAKFHERSIADLITTAPTKIEGNKIVFNHVSDVTVNTYAGSVAWADLTTSKVELNMDQKKYFAFKVSDVNQVQAAGNLIDPHVSEAGYKMQEENDKFVLGLLMPSTDTANKITTAANDLAYDVIVKGNTALNKKKVPKAERYAVINAEVLEQLVLDDRFTKEYKILENGIIEGANINGTQLVFSEELNAGAWGIAVLHKSAIGYGKQLNEMEAMRLEEDFADGIRGLQVYGGVELRKEAWAYCKEKPAVTLAQQPQPQAEEVAVVEEVAEVVEEAPQAKKGDKK